MSSYSTSTFARYSTTSSPSSSTSNFTKAQSYLQPWLPRYWGQHLMVSPFGNLASHQMSKNCCSLFLSTSDSAFNSLLWMIPVLESGTFSQLDERGLPLSNLKCDTLRQLALVTGKTAMEVFACFLCTSLLVVFSRSISPTRFDVLWVKVSLDGFFAHVLSPCSPVSMLYCISPPKNSMELGPHS
jgi:hypothetical protein